jgi:hypothetical protein
VKGADYNMKIYIVIYHDWEDDTVVYCGVNEQKARELKNEDLNHTLEIWENDEWILTED